MRIQVCILQLLLFPVFPSAAQHLYPEVSQGMPLYEIYDMERLDSNRLVMTGMYSRMVSEKAYETCNVLCILDKNGRVTEHRELKDLPPNTFLSGLAVSEDRIFLAGKIMDAGNPLLFTAMYDHELRLLWSERDRSDAIATHVLHEGNDCFTVSGVLPGKMTLLRYDMKNGTVLAAGFRDSSASIFSDNRISELLVTQTGDYAAAVTYSTKEKTGFGVLSADSTGQQRWLRMYGAEEGEALCLAAGGPDLVVAGTYDIRRRNGMLLSIDARGNTHWETHFGGLAYVPHRVKDKSPGSEFRKYWGREMAIRPCDLAILPSGEIQLLGYRTFYTNPGQDDFTSQTSQAVLLTFSRDGQLLRSYAYTAVPGLLPVKMIQTGTSSFLIAANSVGLPGKSCLLSVDMETMQGWEAFTMHTTPY